MTSERQATITFKNSALINRLYICMPKKTTHLYITREMFYSNFDINLSLSLVRLYLM